MTADGVGGAQSWGLTAGAGADGALTFVEQESGDRLQFHAEGEVGDEAGGEGRIFTEQVEQLQAEGLAGLLVGRLDGEVGSNLGGVEAVGVEYPESQHGTLVVRALQVAADEAAYL